MSLWLFGTYEITVGLVTPVGAPGEDFPPNLLPSSPSHALYLEAWMERPFRLACSCSPRPP